MRIIVQGGGSTSSCAHSALITSQAFYKVNEGGVLLLSGLRHSKEPRDGV